MIGSVPKLGGNQRDHQALRALKSRPKVQISIAEAAQLDVLGIRVYSLN